MKLQRFDSCMNKNLKPAFGCSKCQWGKQAVNELISKGMDPNSAILHLDAFAPVKGRNINIAGNRQFFDHFALTYLAYENIRSIVQKLSK